MNAYRSVRSQEKQKYILQLRDLKRPKKPTKRDIRLL